MGVGQYGKNSRATHVSSDKATWAVVYARGVPVPKPDVNMREHERVVAKPSPNAIAIARGVAERREAWSLSEAHAWAIAAAVVQQRVTRRV